MPREISTPLRRALEEPRSAEYVIILLEINHQTLSEPIRVANDVVAYVFEDNTYLGFPFEIEILTDSRQVPRGQVRIQNVDRRIGEAIFNLVTPPTLTITLLANSDFSDVLVDGKRYPIATPVIEYQATNLVF